MNRIISVFVLSVLLAFACGCRMKIQQYETWKGYSIREQNDLKRRIAEKEQSIAELKEEKAKREDEKNFLIDKAKVLQDENIGLKEIWNEMNEDSHHVMQNLYGRLHDSESAFYNVRLGNPPQAMTKRLVSTAYTVLVDMEQAVSDGASICAAELYASGKNGIVANGKLGNWGMVSFAMFYMNENGLYEVRCKTDFMKISEVGLNRFDFSKTPLLAKKGDRYGMILGPGASVDYDELDTGRFCKINLDEFKDDAKGLRLKLDVPAKRGISGPGAMEIALMMLGNYMDKALYVLDVEHKANGTKVYSTARVKIEADKDINNSRCVYFALMSKFHVEGYYMLRDISPMVMVKPGEWVEIVLENTRCADGHVAFEASPGDVCALLMTKGACMAKVNAPRGTLVTDAPFDSSKPFFLKRINELSVSGPQGKEADSNKDFVTFEFE